MDVKILDSWLRDYLETPAKPAEIAKYLSLCGPSVEKVESMGSDHLYHIEITTNRVDSAAVYGIAREASAILPRFGIKAKLKALRLDSKNYTFKKDVNYLEAHVDTNLCPRFTAVLIRNVKIDLSSKEVISRLEKSGVRSINNVVDVSNYVAQALGQPVHTFDYDKIKGREMILRESKKGETIKTLDGKSFTLPGGDIVIEDGGGNLIDLAGIMGGEESAIDENTKNVLLFVQNYNPTNIRKTSMALAHRTSAATIFEKGTDAELVGPATLFAINLFESLAKGEADPNILNIYPRPYKVSSVQISENFINERLGTVITKKDITAYLSSLGFESIWKGGIVDVKIPSFRAKDIKSPEDVLEEIARIYGYHNLPSKIMDGSIPVRPENPKFGFEMNLRNIISGFGGTETYTLSLVPESSVDEKHLTLKNPLGSDTKCLRTSLMPSVIEAAKGNAGLKERFHLFEIANIYVPKHDDLPTELMTLAGVFSGYTFRRAKGIIEALLERLNTSVIFKSEEEKRFDASKCAFIYKDGVPIGKIGIPENTDMIYYEFEVEKLMKYAKYSMNIPSFRPIPKYPAQIEDINFELPEKTKIGEVLEQFNNTKFVAKAELIDIYKDFYTFRVWYQDETKTLTDHDVEGIRNIIISSLKSKFGGNLKD
jgi:phenylalanyl-tRNA synthetase beta chain